MKKYYSLILLSSLMLSVCLCGCKRFTPSDIIPEDKMEEILYDYALAHSLASVANDSINYRTNLYTDAVFKKYKITQDEFDHSMTYYARHSDQLYDIYKRVYGQFSQVLGERSTLSSSADGVAYDSITLWHGDEFNILSPKLARFITFEVDTAKMKFEKGDRICLEAQLEWLSASHSRSTMFVTFLTYANDSVVTHSRTYYTAGNHEMGIQLDTLKVKSISGFIYQRSLGDKGAHQLFVLRPRLMRVRKSELPPKEKRTTDTIQTADALKAPKGNK